MPAFRLRPATLQDAELLLAWRNDPQTRRSSHNNAQIELSAHLIWLEAALVNSSRQILIAEAEGVPVGSLRVDRQSDGVSELSWTVAPAARGQGVGRHMLAALLARISGPVRAEIKQGNTASIRIAESVGLTLNRAEADVLHYVGSGKKQLQP